MEIVDQTGKGRGTDAERGVLLVAYILHGLSFMGITAVIALIISYVKVRETKNEFIRSHHLWLLRTFWWGLLWLCLCFLSIFMAFFSGIFGVGTAGFFIVLIWWLYRVIYGAINFFESKPMPV